MAVASSNGCSFGTRAMLLSPRRARRPKLRVARVRVLGSRPSNAFVNEARPAPGRLLSKVARSRGELRLQADGRRQPSADAAFHVLDDICVATHSIGMVEVIALDGFAVWYAELDDADLESVTQAVDVLAMVGPTLGHPRSSAIKGAALALRALRIRSQGKPSACSTRSIRSGRRCSSWEATRQATSASTGR